MVFGRDFTAEELASLGELDRIYDAMLPIPSAENTITAAAAHRHFLPMRALFVDAARTGPFALTLSHPNAALATQWSSLMRAVTAEVVLRLGQNFRKTPTVLNELLQWRIVYQKAEQHIGVPVNGGDGGRELARTWMHGITLFFTHRLERLFAQFNLEEAESAVNTPAPTRALNGRANGGVAAAAVVVPPPALRGTFQAGMEGEELVSRCISIAQATVTAEMSASPPFVDAVRTCWEMVLSMQLLQGLLSYFCATTGSSPVSSAGVAASRSGTGGVGRTAVSVELSFAEDYLAILRSPTWLFRFLFLFLGAVNLLQLSGAATESAGMLSAIQRDNALHCIACIIKELDGKRRDGDVKATLDALVLGYVKQTCTSRFPPQQMLHLLTTLDSWGGAPAQLTAATHNHLSRSHLENEEEEVRVKRAAASSGEFLQHAAPLVQQLLVGYPSFMANMRAFTRRNSIQDWGTDVMLVQLFCWDTATPPPVHAANKANRAAAVAMMGVAAAEVGTVRYHVPNDTNTGTGGNAAAEFGLPSTALYAMVRGAMRPLLAGLLTPTIDSDRDTPLRHIGAEGTGNVTATAGVGSASGNAPLLSGVQQRICAQLLALVAWLNTISFSSSARMPRWGALDVGPQVLREFHLGRWCLTKVVPEVVQDVLHTTFLHVEASTKLNEELGAATTRGHNEDGVFSLGPALLRYLLHVERVWDALTEQTIELSQDAVEYLRSLGVTTLPESVANTITSNTHSAASATASSTVMGEHSTTARYYTGLLATRKHDFYDAVLLCLQRCWPREYADLLTDPLLRTLHVYLVQSESGSAAAPPASGRPPVEVKRPPPLPAAEKTTPAAAAAGGAGNHARPGGAGGPPANSAVPLASLDDFHGALRLVRCIKNLDRFLQSYTAGLKERLMWRPTPEVGSDEEVVNLKRTREKEAEEYLVGWLGDAASLRSVRDLHTHFQPQTTTFNVNEDGFNATGTNTGGGGVFKLTVTLLDWRIWEDVDASSGGIAAMTNNGKSHGEGIPTVAELRGFAQDTMTTAAQDEAPLPFPLDVVIYLEQMEHAYTGAHLNRNLRWNWQQNVFTSFTLAYPQDNGRLTTVHGELLLQRLFLAIAAYGRKGVRLQTLAARGGVDERRIFAMLKLCLNRDRLIVRVDEAGVPIAAANATTGPTTRLALNYAWTRPPNRPRGEFSYWTNATNCRFTGREDQQDKMNAKRKATVRTSIIQVMKQAQRIHHDELFAKVREKNAKMFEVTVRSFKQAIEELIEKGFMIRSEQNPQDYVFQA